MSQIKKLLLGLIALFPLSFVTSIYLSRFLVQQWLGHFVQVFIHSFIISKDLMLHWVCSKLSLHTTVPRLIAVVVVLLHFPSYHLTFIQYDADRIDEHQLILDRNKTTSVCCRAHACVP